MIIEINKKNMYFWLRIEKLNASKPLYHVSINKLVKGMVIVFNKVFIHTYIRLFPKDFFFNLRGRYLLLKLSWSCKLWKMVGWKSCPVHGFHAQSWFTGECRKCKTHKYKGRRK